MTGGPRTIGRYEIRRELGRGMMGVVYEAVDTVLHRTIALKTIDLAYSVTPDEREAFERRFLAEARAAARLNHPNIVVVHDVGRDVHTGTLFMALEYLQGRTLAELLAGGNGLEWRQALQITALLAAALQVAHSQGIIHRDIKPANIMLLPSGEPKIMDFGIAKVQASELTGAGQVFGTPSFMSPEQALGQPLDGRSDLFSLGTVLYQLLTGQKAFPGEHLPQVVALVIRKDPPPPSHVAPAIPPAVDYVTARVLAKAPDDRYPGARALAEDIEDVLAGRPPRHRGTLTSPVRAEGTLASAAPLASAALGSQPSRTPTELEQALDHLAASAKTTTAPSTEKRSPIPPRSSARPPAPPWEGRGPRSRVGLVLGLGAVLGVAAALIFARWSGHPAEPIITLAQAPPPTEPTTIASPAANPSAAPPQGTRSELAPTAAPSLPPAVVRKEPAPRRPPSAAKVPPAPAPQPPTTPPAAVSRTTSLLIDFEHPLKTGSLKVWVDEALVFDDDIEGRVTREVAGLRIHKGKIKHTIPVLPGRHDVRVRVAWEDNVKTEVLGGTFKEGSTRQLEVRLGRILKNLSLEWK